MHEDRDADNPFDGSGSADEEQARGSEDESDEAGPQSRVCSKRTIGMSDRSRPSFMNLPHCRFK